MKNKWAMAALVLAVWALVASLFAGFYWLQYNDLNQRTSGVLITVNVGVDYGNGTRTYYNDTKAVSGETLFDVTKRASTVEYTVGSLGVEVNSINGLSKQGDYGWTYWTWNSTSSSWSIVWAGADAYQLVNGETVMWYYENAFNPPP